MARIEDSAQLVLSGLKSVEIHEQVATCLKLTPAEEREYRQRRQDGAVAAFDAREEQRNPARVLGHSVEESQAILDSQFSTIENDIRKMRANSAIELRRTSLIDLTGGRARHAEEDLRDVKTLAAEHTAPAMDIDKSVVRIYRDGKPTIRLLDRMNLAVVDAATSPLHYDRDGELLKLGIVPLWVFDGRYQVEPREGDSGQQEIVGRDAEGNTPRFIVTLRPDGVTYSRIVIFDEAGSEPAVTYKASDYRDVDGHAFPFRTSKQISARGMPDYWVERRRVEKVRVNVEVPDEAFAIPDGYAVQDPERLLAHTQ